MKEFYLITTPGIEDLAEQELFSWFPEAKPVKQYGGILVEMPLEEGLSMNLALKIPTRILMRVESFKCRDFPKLFQKISRFPWDRLLHPHCQMEAHVSTSKSRLSIKKRIKETSEEAWRAFQKKSGVTAPSDERLNLYVRFHEDVCTLSLDTSGERLHKRGNDKHIGEAPLRETLAAAMIEMISSENGDSHVEIVDPMLGSGTLLSESALKNGTVDSRDFAWTHFKCEEVPFPVFHGPALSLRKFIGFEQDSQTFKAAKFNLGKIVDPNRLELFQKDFFKATPLPSTPSHRWILCNPPYGERLQVAGPLKDFYEKLFQQMERVCRPDRICILLPSKPLKGKLKLPPLWKVIKKKRTSNGGLPIDIYLFARIKNS